MELLDIKSFSNVSIPTNLRSNDKFVFVEQDDKFNNINILKYDFNTKEIVRFKFDRSPEIVSCITAKDTIFYANIVFNENKFAIDIKKSSCNDWKEEKVLTIITDFTKDKGDDLSNPFSDCKLVGLNERYAILAIPHFELAYGRPFFEKMLLIDSVEKRTIVIPHKIKDYDSLLRLDDVWIVKKGEYITFKTGRIHFSEKEQFWNECLAGGTNKEYFDSIESLVTIRIEDFIDNVLTGTELLDNTIIKTTDFKGCLRFLENGADITEDNNRNIIYVVQSFENKTTEIVFYNLETGQENVKKINELYKDIRYYNEVFYSVSECFTDGEIQKDMTPSKTLTHIDVYDIFKNVKIQTVYDENLVYVDDKILATSKFIKDTLEKEITILNLLDGSKKTFLTRHFLYFSVLNLLLFY